MTRIPGHHAPIDYHVALIADPWRVAAWEQAIRRTVRPGDVVLDVGTGTGIMAIWAARAGARVIAVESSWTADLARRTVADSGVADRVEVVAADLATLTPEPVDVILCDLVGRWLPEDDLRRAVVAASAWATADTHWLPGRIDLRAAPVGDFAMPALDRLATPLLGANLSAALAAGHARFWPVSLPPAACMAAAHPVGELAPPDLPETVVSRGTWTLERPGRLRGVAGWFTAALTDQVALDTGPGRTTFWGQTLWPCPEVHAQAGDVVQVEVAARSEVGQIRFAWRIAVRRGQELLLDHTADADPVDPPTGAQASAGPAGDPADLIRRGRAALHRGDPTSAARWLGQASVATPTLSRDLLADLGRAHLQAGYPHLAAPPLVAAADLASATANPTPTRALNDLAAALRALGDPAVDAILAAHLRGGEPSS